MRDRLIELLANSGCSADLDTYQEIADYLLANGVIIPPCKVGDKVYQHGKKFNKCTAYDYTPRYEDDAGV